MFMTVPVYPNVQSQYSDSDKKRSYKNAHVVSAILFEKEVITVIIIIIIISVFSTNCLPTYRTPHIIVSTRTCFTHQIICHLERNHIRNPVHKTFFLKIQEFSLETFCMVSVSIVSLPSKQIIKT